MLRTIRRSLLIVFLVLGASYLYLIWDNNRKVPAPTRDELFSRLDKSIQWLETHRDAIFNDNYQIFWWMLDRSAALTQNSSLTALVAEYKHRYVDPYPQSVWSRFFIQRSPARTPNLITDGWHYSTVYFAYALTCDSDLAKEEFIANQRRPDFCLHHHLFSPACVTHQLMGVRLAQQNHCYDPEESTALIKSLQDTIVNQLTYDPRVLDVYLQRVTTLTESGAAARVKPRWLQRILEAQHADGGWGDEQSLIAVGGQRYLCITPRLPGIRRLTSDLHATAQGILLLSLLTAGK